MVVGTTRGIHVTTMATIATMEVTTRGTIHGILADIILTTIALTLLVVITIPATTTTIRGTPITMVILTTPQQTINLPLPMMMTQLQTKMMTRIRT